MRPDRWVEAGGTLVNLIGRGHLSVGFADGGSRANLRYFFWILAALNLLPGAGYFVFSGLFGFGDWQEVIRGLPNQVPLRIMMTILGAALYVGGSAPPRGGNSNPCCTQRRTYNIVGKVSVLCSVPLQLRCGCLIPDWGQALPCINGPCGVRRILRPAVG